jgi:uncharacterized protein with FMN-binding domain
MGHEEKGMKRGMVLFLCAFVFFGSGRSRVALTGTGNEPAHDMNSERDSLDSADAKTSREKRDNSVGFLKDGTYTAESPGWTGMKVLIVVQKGKICNIQVLKAKGSPRFYQTVVDRMPRKIIRKGSPEVDGVTGATLSSNSLKEAVRLALEKARQNEG